MSKCLQKSNLWYNSNRNELVVERNKAKEIIKGEIIHEG